MPKIITGFLLLLTLGLFLFSLLQFTYDYTHVINNNYSHLIYDGVFAVLFSIWYSVFENQLAR
jgi:hypothetical protein